MTDFPIILRTYFVRYACHRNNTLSFEVWCFPGLAINTVQCALVVLSTDENLQLRVKHGSGRRMIDSL